MGRTPVSISNSYLRFAGRRVPLHTRRPAHPTSPPSTQHLESKIQRARLARQRLSILNHRAIKSPLQRPAHPQKLHPTNNLHLLAQTTPPQIPHPQHPIPKLQQQRKPPPKNRLIRFLLPELLPAPPRPNNALPLRQPVPLRRLYTKPQLPVPRTTDRNPGPGNPFPAFRPALQRPLPLPPPPTPRAIRLSNPAPETPTSPHDLEQRRWARDPDPSLQAYIHDL